MHFIVPAFPNKDLFNYSANQFDSHKDPCDVVAGWCQKATVTVYLSLSCSRV